MEASSTMLIGDITMQLTHHVHDHFSYSSLIEYENGVGRVVYQE